MKSFSFTTFLLIAAILITAGLALAQGKYVTGPDGKFSQLSSPYPAASDCTTTTTTKGTIKSVTVTGYSQLCFASYTGAGKTPTRIKRHLGSNTAHMPSTGDCIALNKDMTTVAFKPYSGTAHAYTVCTELTRGGVTP